MKDVIPRCITSQEAITAFWIYGPGRAAVAPPLVDWASVKLVSDSLSTSNHQTVLIVQNDLETFSSFLCWTTKWVDLLQGQHIKIARDFHLAGWIFWIVWCHLCCSIKSHHAIIYWMNMSLVEFNEYCMFWQCFSVQGKLVLQSSQHLSFAPSTAGWWMVWH